MGGGGAEVDLLSIPLAFGAEFTSGRVSLFPSVGLEVGYPIAARISSNLETGFGRSPAAEASGFAGLGIGVDLPRGLRVDLEARRLRGFGAAFEGSAGRRPGVAAGRESPPRGEGDGVARPAVAPVGMIRAARTKPGDLRTEAAGRSRHSAGMRSTCPG